jgi:hypothetical protein
MDRDPKVVESELYRLIRFLADPETAPCGRRFSLRHDEIGTIAPRLS